VRVTFVPLLAEHLAARRAMARIAPIPDATGALPRLLAVVLLGTLITRVAEGGGEPWVVIWPSALALFFTGVGLRMMAGRYRAITYDIAADAIEVRQPRHRWRIARGDIVAAGETAEFFVAATRRAAFYIPKRALRDADDEAELRAWLPREG
jgi:hypothetical protein